MVIVLYGYNKPGSTVYYSIMYYNIMNGNLVIIVHKIAPGEGMED